MSLPPEVAGIPLAGERARFIDEGDKTTIIFDDKGTGRMCGSCTLCCKVMPMPIFKKPAGKPCQHQRTSKGCLIYKDRPNACRQWWCRWLADPTTSKLPRPDRSHLVIDMLDDYITAIHNETGIERKIGALQVWIDPAFPDAHREPRFRAWVSDQAARHHCVAIIRYDESRAMTLVPPQVSDDGEWHEIWDMHVEPEHHEMREADVVVTQR